MLAPVGPERVGIIGAGFIAACRLKGLRSAGGADLRMIAGRLPERTAGLAAYHGIAACATDWRPPLPRYICRRFSCTAILRWL
jgi:predicted dehydrogenase